MPTDKPESDRSPHQILPRTKPGDQPYSSRLPPRRFTDDQHIRRGVAPSDQLTQWNVAQDLSDHQPEASDVPRRAVSSRERAALLPPDARKWSWLPRDIEPEKISIGGSSDPLLHSPGLQVADAADVDVADAADRRLSMAQRAIETKKKSRRERKSLKESGDYLGVQGFNPETGEADILSPTNSEGSTIHRDLEDQLVRLRRRLRDARNKKSAEEVAQDAEEVLAQLEEGDIERLHQDKRTRIEKSVKWRKHTRQWSSTREPVLSPIVQSRPSTVQGSRK